MSCRIVLSLAFACALVIEKLQAQDSLSVDMLVPHQAVKLSPLHMLNFYPTVELSFEQYVYGRFTAQLELGYVVNVYDPRNLEGDDEFLNKRGLKGKLEVRNYFWGRADRRKLYYGAVEAYMNVIDFDRSEWRQECFDLECNSVYQKEYLYKVEYREQGMNLKAGVLRYIASSDFFIDINSGFTIRNVHYKKPDLVGEFEEDEWRFIKIPNERDRVTLSPNLGIRLGYRFR